MGSSRYYAINFSGKETLRSIDYDQLKFDHFLLFVFLITRGDHKLVFFDYVISGGPPYFTSE